MYQTYKTFINTKGDHDVAKYRLDCLLDEKSALYAKYFPTTSKLKDTVSHSNVQNDRMADYVHALTKINKITGTSLEQEIEEQKNLVGKLKYYLDLMEHTLKTMKGIENELFNEIIVNCRKPTRAVHIVAEKHNMDESTIWNNYYPKIKKVLKSLVKVE